MEKQNEKNSHGGRREGAGRKKTVVKRVAFNAPADVAEILTEVKGSMSDYINDAIRAYSISPARAKN